MTKTPEGFLTEARKSTEPFDRTEKKLDSLKRFHRREMLRIGARDILREAHIMTITIELSSLADSIIESVLSIGREDLKRTAGIFPTENPLAVVGLGKLGGNELNFSSDIDLMFVYDRDEEFPNAPPRMRSMSEYSARLSEFVVRKLSEHTDEGHLYRVDIRLRPDGGVGPIAMSTRAYRSYYESRGELWERQMLLKARTVAGNKTVGEAWLKNLEPFVFPKTHLASPLKEISEMKKRIESRISGEANIKLGSGGIRDVEFIVQALQLLNGGNNRNIRGRPTMKALSQMAEEGILDEAEKKDLSEAYEFLRIVEHRLQLLHGQQTHSLPVSAEDTDKLSKSLGFVSPSDFEITLNSKRKRVREIFNSIFLQGSTRTLPSESKSSSVQAIGKLKFVDRPTALKALHGLFTEIPGLQDSRVQEFLPRAFKKYGGVDCALANLSFLVSQTNSRRSLRQAIENRKLLDLLIMLSSRSSRMVESLRNEPLLFESLLMRPEEMLSKTIGWQFMLQSDPFRYKVFNEFKSCLRFLLGYSTIEEVSKHLATVADHVVLHAFEKKIGLNGVCILALGRYGGEELGIGSDLDIVCVYDKNRSSPEIEQCLKDFLAYFEKPSTKIYDIDLRLRPEGKSAPLATALEYYDSYLKSRASLWEKQSLLKARIVGGDPAVAKKLSGMIDGYVWQNQPKSWAGEIIRMRKKMEKERMKGRSGQDLKLGKGGMVDIEFLVQAIQMKIGYRMPGLRVSSTFEALRMIKKKALISSPTARMLQFNYRYLRTMDMMIRLNSTAKTAVFPREKILQEALRASMREKSILDVKKRLARIQKLNRSSFMKTLRSFDK